jgi:cytochrome c
MAMLADADIEKGAKISKACAACHSFEKGGPTKQGPNLWGVVGNIKGHVNSFSYSDDLLAKGGNWDYDSLNNFLEKPKKYINGTKMNFAGLRKAKDRAAVIAWLRQQSDSPAPLPSAEEIEAEQAAFAPPAPEEESTEAAADEATETEEEAPTEH